MEAADFSQSHAGPTAPNHEVADGMSRFANRVYVGFRALADTIADLDAFRTQIHGGILDVRFGEFGCEYANGAFHAGKRWQVAPRCTCARSPFSSIDSLTSVSGSRQLPMVRPAWRRSDLTVTVVPKPCLRGHFLWRYSIIWDRNAARVGNDPSADTPD